MKKIQSLRLLLFIIGCVLVVIIGVFVFIMLPLIQNGSTPNPGSTNQPPSNQSPIQKTQIGITKEREVARLPGAQKISLPNNKTGYILPSSLKTRPNLITIKEGVVDYEREITPDDPSNPNYLSLYSIVAKYGQPDRSIKGSSYYGAFLSTYIYSSIGFSVIANTYTSEVYEIQFFSPLSPEEYLKQFGEDVNPNTKPPQETF